MNSLKRLSNITGLVVLAVAMVVYFMSVERVGSLWDCGEFILGAYKLQVVHPPGAPLYVLIGRIFTWFAEILSDDPADIAFAVNLMSGLCSALAAMMICWVTIMLTKLSWKGREGETTDGENLAIAAGGLVAGLSTAFASSIWFSAVEGEVYAMSTFFTALTLWSAVKWYYLSDDLDNDRWLVLSLFCGGLSIGVHLLSLLTFPAIGLLYYFKKYKEPNIKGGILSILAGVFMIGFIQKIVIVGIPTIWAKMELFTVNSMGMGVHSGLIPTILILAALSFGAFYLARRMGSHLLHILSFSAVLIMIAFSTIGVVVIRANADTPVNMNVPSDAMRLLPYLNREQYGERALVKGPHFDARPIKVNKSPRYGLVGDKYEVVDEKYEYEYASKDQITFPRIGHTESSRPTLHRRWKKYLTGNDKGKPTSGMYNMKYMFSYQFNWMYWRYFMWNFVGKQNGSQGYEPWDLKAGHWESGLSAFDESSLLRKVLPGSGEGYYEQDAITDVMKNNESKNHYFFLPLIFGLFGLLFHARNSPKEFMAIMMLFLMTGLGIIIYSNQPPNEPRERDYVLVGSFMTFCIWIGMAVPALYSIFKERLSLPSIGAAGMAAILVLSAPVIMGFQNFDDHSRAHHTASRDYASNFLNSVDENAIIFTYGDNDTYPLWYAQEVEGIRRDVRVVNLSLIAVDWYINKLRNKVNDSPALKLTIPAKGYRGKNKNQVYFATPAGIENNPEAPIEAILNYMNDPRSIRDDGAGNRFNTLPTRNIFIPANRDKLIANGLLSASDTINRVGKIPIKFSDSKGYLLKDEVAILDVIGSNFADRAIYFAVTCKNEKLLGLNDYMQMEGLGLRLVPFDSGSDRNLPGLYGSGRLDIDKTFDNVMTKWKWGNFDTVDTYVNGSYGAEVTAMKVIMLRLSSKLTEMRDNERAALVANKYFESFPHNNFTYDASIIPFINVLLRANKYDDAKKHIRILAIATSQNMTFYESLHGEVLASSWRDDMRYDLRSVNDLLSISSQMEDPDFLKEMEGLLKEYMPSQTPVKN